MRQYSSYLRILLIGEGDFSFAANYCQALLKNNVDVIVYATELRTADELRKVYPDTFTGNISTLDKMYSVSTSFGVDATNLDQSNIFKPNEDWLVFWLAPYVPINTCKVRIQTPDRQRYDRVIRLFREEVEEVTRCDKRVVTEKPKQIVRWSHQAKVMDDFFTAVEMIKNKYNINVGVVLGIPLTSKCIKRRFNSLAYSDSFTPTMTIDLDGLHQFKTTKGNKALDKIHSGTFKGIYFTDPKNNSLTFEAKVQSMFAQCSISVGGFEFDLTETPRKPSTDKPKITPSKYMSLFLAKRPADCSRKLFGTQPSKLSHHSVGPK